MKNLECRVWCDSYDEMFYDIVGYRYYYSKEFNAEQIFVYYRKGFDSTFQGELMLYVGLKDKNGKKIFDGDILMYLDITSDEYIMSRNRIMGIVRWDKYKCGFRPRDIKENHRGCHYYSYWDQLEEIEIVGNIYENKDLLT